jgi:hypothetical protein
MISSSITFAYHLVDYHIKHSSLQHTRQLFLLSAATGLVARRRRGNAIAPCVAKLQHVLLTTSNEQ